MSGHAGLRTRYTSIGRITRRYWQRWTQNHPIASQALGVPVKMVKSAVGTTASILSSAPVGAAVSAQMHHLVGDATYFGVNIADATGGIAAGTIAVAGTAIATGVPAAIKRWRHRNDPPEPDPAERLEAVEKSATRANEQATRANTRLGVVDNRLTNLEAAVQQQRTDPQVEQRLAALEAANQQMQQARQQDQATIQQQQAMIQQLVAHAQGSDQQVGALRLENQQLRQQVQAVGQQASTADARAVLAQNEVRDVQAHQLLQDGRLDAVTNELQQRTTGASPQPPSSEPLPDDLAARARAAQARALQQRAAARGRQPQPNQPQPGLRTPNPQPRQDPHRPSR